MRRAIGRMRLEGVQVYERLGEVYQVLRLVVNCFQPSVKLQEHFSSGDQGVESMISPKRPWSEC